MLFRRALPAARQNSAPQSLFMKWVSSVEKLVSDWSTAILAVGQAGILPAVARKTTGKMLAAASWKPMPRPAHLLFNRAKWAPRQRDLGVNIDNRSSTYGNDPENADQAKHKRGN